MATPFEYFRKHTGLMMAILCALLMLAFVVADPLTTYLNDQNRAPGVAALAKDVVVEWADGKLTEGDLAELVNNRQVLAAFLQTIEQEGLRSALMAGLTNPPYLVAPLQLATTLEQGVERDVVQIKVFADAAREAGMLVSNETLIEYLRGLGRNRVSNEQVRSLLASMQVGRGRRPTIEYMLGLLREEMLAREYGMSYQYAMQTLTPQERWRDWLKVNDRVVAEVAALEVSSFLDKTPAPTEAELQAFYEEHKDRVPSPEEVDNTELPSPTPGFTTPKRVQLEYVRGDLAPLADKLVASVTDAEVEEFYNENKDLFVKAPGAAPAKDGPAEAADEEEAAADDSEEATPGADQEAGATEDDATKDASTEEDAASDAGDPPAEGAAPAGPAPGTSGARNGGNPFRLVAQATPAQESAADDDTASADPQPDASSEAPADDKDSPAEESPDEDNAEEKDPAGDGDEADEPEYQPLDEVRDEVRRRLAERKASEQLGEKFQALYDRMNEAYTTYFTARLDAEAEGKPAPAAPPELADLKGLAEAEGLEHAKTDETTFLELRDTPIGKSFDADETHARSLPVWFAAFGGDGLDPFEPMQTIDPDGNRYLLLRIGGSDKTTPELSEVRDDVERAWRMQKAADLALARAEELAKQAGEAGLTLEASLDDEEGLTFEETDPFSWLTPGNVTPAGFVQLRLSDPKPVRAAGPAFMEEVFSLEPGKVGAALNHDRSVAYVIRVAERPESQAELREAFLSEWATWYGLPYTMQGRRSELSNELFQALIGADSLDWKRPPDQPRSAEG